MPRFFKFRAIRRNVWTLLGLPTAGDLQVQIFVKDVIRPPIELFMKCTTTPGRIDVHVGGVNGSPVGEVEVAVPRPVRCKLWGEDVKEAIAYVEAIIIQEEAKEGKEGESLFKDELSDMELLTS